jgi:hypothetical protein
MDFLNHRALCKAIGERRRAAVIDMQTWPVENMRPSASGSGVPPLYPGRPAWVDDIPAFLVRNTARLAAFKRLFSRIRASSLMTLEEYCRTVARQVLFDERMELPNIWAEAYGPDKLVSPGKLVALYGLAGFHIETVGPDGNRIKMPFDPKTCMLPGPAGDEHLTTHEFYSRHFGPSEAGAPPTHFLELTFPFAGALVPRNCDNCKKPAACRCICNEAYCSRACQEAHWPYHRELHDSVQRMNEHLFTLTKVYWAEQFGLRD